MSDDSSLNRFFAYNSMKSDITIQQFLDKTKELHEDFMTLSDGQETAVIVAALTRGVATAVLSQPKELRSQLFKLLYKHFESLSELE